MPAHLTIRMVLTNISSTDVERSHLLFCDCFCYTHAVQEGFVVTQQFVHCPARDDDCPARQHCQVSLALLHLASGHTANWALLQLHTVAL